VPVSQSKLDDERRKAGERLEKEEARIDRTQVSTNQPKTEVKGMTPIGMYSRTSVTHSDHVQLAFTIGSLLTTCELTFLRRETIDGRPGLVFKFSPRAGASFREGEGYLAQLTGEMVIDAQDHIVSKLTGWLNGVDHTAAPAVYEDMTRLKDGTWLPHLTRVNAGTYPTLSEKVNWDWSSTFSNFVRFTTEVKDVKVDAPPPD
ncbi:MAG TPA: hypothetical protein VE961_04300, partial [Pyrinomonadaceae bacterium]|nr:hypothetical protein [Pyrinomonadaceae bacterium]